jgi:hypothetical protein
MIHSEGILSRYDSRFLIRLENDDFLSSLETEVKNGHYRVEVVGCF